MCRMTLLAATVLYLAGVPALASAQANAMGASAQANGQPTVRPVVPGAATAAPVPAAIPTPAAAPAAQPASPQQRAEVERLDPLARAAFWATEVDNNPRDTEAGVRLAHALRDLGRFEEAAAAAEQVLVVEPANLEAMLEAGRARIGQGQAFYGIEPLQTAAVQAPRDWRPLSLLAIAFEQTQRDDEALVMHQRAMALAPANPGVVANLALYYAGHGDAAQAEQLLRRAVAMPGATAQIRQDLALVLGLQGHFDEAERLARQDLPPDVVANNMAYLRAASAQTPVRSWDSVRGP